MGIDKDKNIVDPVELRNRAENQLFTNAPEVGLYRTDSEMHRLIHELEVHQIELEMMNAELRQSRDDAEMSLEKYTDLYEFAPVGYFTLDSKGIINAVNIRGASVVGVARPRLLGQRFSLLVTDDYRRIFADFLHTVFTHQDKSTCEVALQNKGNNRVYVLIEAMFGPGSAHTLPCTIRIVPWSVWCRNAPPNFTRAILKSCTGSAARENIGIMRPAIMSPGSAYIPG